MVVRGSGLVVLLVGLWGGASAAAAASQPLEFQVQEQVQLRHLSSQITPDGRYLIGVNGTAIRVWDLELGRQLRTWVDPACQVSKLAISRDGRRLATVCKEGGIILRQLVDRDPVAVIDQAQRYGGIAFSPDGTRLLAGSGKRWALFDTSNGALIRGGDEPRGVGAVGFANDGQQFLFAPRGAVLVVDAETAEHVRTFETGKNGWVQSFSPDGEHAFVGTNNPDYSLWSTRLGKLVRTYNLPGSESFAWLSSDGSRIVLTSKQQTGLWDAKTGRPLGSFKALRPGVFAVSPDGSFFVGDVREYYKTPRPGIYDTRTGTLKRRLGGDARKLRVVQISPDGRYVLTGGEDGTVRAWDLATARLHHTFRGHAPNSVVFELAITPDGKRVYSSDGNEGKTLSWDLASAKDAPPFESQIRCRGLSKQPLSRDGRFLLLTSEIGLCYADLNKGHQNLYFKGPAKSRATLSPDGRFLITTDARLTGPVAADEPSVTVWDWANIPKRMGGELQPLRSVQLRQIYKKQTSITKDKRVKLEKLAVSATGMLIASGYGWHGVIDLESGETVHDLRALQATQPNAVAISADGRVAVTSTAQQINILDGRTWQVSKVLSSGGAGIVDVALSPDGKRVFAAGADGALRMWDIQSGSTLSMLAVGDEWLVYTEDGIFDASPAGAPLVAMVQGARAFGIDQLALKNNRPDLILERFGFGSPELRAHYRAQYHYRLRKAGINENTMGDALEMPTVEITSTKQRGRKVDMEISTTDTTGLKSYQIFINDVPLFGGGGKALSGEGALAKETFLLTEGHNKVEVSVTNERGHEAPRAFVELQCKEKTPGDLHFVGFGVSRYLDESLNLSYAHKDALDLAALFRKTKGFRKVHVHTFTDEQVTVERIRAAKGLLAKARPEDTVVLFIAGHGMHERSEEAGYYYLTHETQLDNLSTSAAGFELFEELLTDVAPRRKLFLMDTCESGERQEAVEEGMLAHATSLGFAARAIRSTRGIKSNKAAAGTPKADRSWLLQRDRFVYLDLARQSGAIVLSSSRGGELSYESSELQNGFFTRAIVDAIGGGKADANKDGWVSTDELRIFVAREVAERSGGLQNPTVDRDNIFQKFTFKR